MSLEMGNVSSLTVFPPVRFQLPSLRLDARDEHARTILFVYERGSMVFGVDPIERDEERCRSGPKPDKRSAQVSGEDREKPPQVVVTGRVGRDPELRTTPRGLDIVKIPIAAHNGEITTWHQVLFFGDMARIAADSLAKGQLVTLSGRERLRELVMRNGVRRQVKEIHAVTVEAATGREP